PPEIEAIELDADVFQIVKLEAVRLEVADVAAHADVRRKESHRAAPEIDREVVVRNRLGTRNDHALHPGDIQEQVPQADASERLDRADCRTDKKVLGKRKDMAFPEAVRPVVHDLGLIGNFGLRTDDLAKQAEGDAV